MSDKESESAPTSAAHQQKQAAAGLFGPSLVSKQNNNSLPVAQKSPIDLQPNGYYQNVTQKAKLILPTALWILIGIVGICFLSLLSSLNKSISTLDTLVEIEQAKAKSASGEHGHHGSASAQQQQHPHREKAALAAVNSDMPIAERLQLSNNDKGASFASGEPAVSHHNGRETNRYEHSIIEPSMFSFPSWASLEPRGMTTKSLLFSGEKSSASDSSSNSIESLLDDIIQTAASESEGNSGKDKFLPVGGSIIIASSSSSGERGQDVPESMIDSMFDKLFGGDENLEPTEKSTADKNKADAARQIDSLKAGPLITANIDRVNININMPPESKESAAIDSDARRREAASFVRPYSMAPGEYSETNSNKPFDSSIDDLLSMLVGPSGVRQQQPDEVGEQSSLFLPLTPSMEPHSYLLSQRLRGNPLADHRASHHHHRPQNRLSSLLSMSPAMMQHSSQPPMVMSPLSDILMGPIAPATGGSPFDMLGQPISAPTTNGDTLVIEFGGNDDNEQQELRQRESHHHHRTTTSSSIQPSGPVNSPYEFTIPAELADQLISPFFGAEQQHQKTRKEQRESEEQTRVANNENGLQLFSDELASSLIKSLFPTQEANEASGQKQSNEQGKDNSGEEILFFNGNSLVGDRKQSLSREETPSGANHQQDRNQVSDLFELMFGQPPYSKLVAPQIIEPEIKVVESIGAQNTKGVEKSLRQTLSAGTSSNNSKLEPQSFLFDGTQMTPIMPFGIALSVGKNTDNNGSSSEQAPVEKEEAKVSGSPNFKGDKTVENLVSDILGQMISMPQFGGVSEPMIAEAQSSGNSGSSSSGSGNRRSSSSSSSDSGSASVPKDSKESMLCECRKADSSSGSNSVSSSRSPSGSGSSSSSSSGGGSGSSAGNTTTTRLPDGGSSPSSSGSRPLNPIGFVPMPAGNRPLPSAFGIPDPPGSPITGANFDNNQRQSGSLGHESGTGQTRQVPPSQHRPVLASPPL